MLSDREEGGCGVQCRPPPDDQKMSSTPCLHTPHVLPTCCSPSRPSILLFFVFRKTGCVPICTEACTNPFARTCISANVCVCVRACVCVHLAVSQPVRANVDVTGYVSTCGRSEGPGWKCAVALHTTRDSILQFYTPSPPSSSNLSFRAARDEEGEWKRLVHGSEGSVRKAGSLH